MLNLKKIILIFGALFVLFAIIFSFVNVQVGQKKHQKLWGAYLANNNVTAFENSVGKKMDMQAIFVGWGDSFPLNSDKTKTLVIFWEQTGITLDQVIAGKSDLYIEQFAKNSATYGAPIILVPLNEMNGNWDTWDGSVGDNTPEKDIEAFRHIHDLFAGVSNVKFAFDVNNQSVPDNPENAIAKYYPGESYVDYVGVDGFNFGDPWQTYSEIFSSALQQLKIYNKPIYIFSVACTQGPKKAEWITDALAQIKSNANIFGFIWFNENKEKNWLVNSDVTSLEAFKNGIK